MLKPPRILTHGVAGVGKTTFAAASPRPVILRTEDGLGTLDVPHFRWPEPSTTSCKPSTRSTPRRPFQTLVVDSIDWLEPLVWARVFKDHGWASIEEAGYGKGYVNALDLWRQPAAVLKSGETTANGATRVLGTSCALFDDRFEIDPATGAAWTKAGVDALEAGVEVVP